jgi:hypothetical protein
MPKKKLTDIAEEYEISFEQAQDLVSNNLEEDMVTGRGKNTWISESGQIVIEEIIPINVIYRGKVMHVAPNPRYVFVYIRELGGKVPVQIPLRRISNLVGKVIHVEADNKGSEPKYFYRKKP